MRNLLKSVLTCAGILSLCGNTSALAQTGDALEHWRRATISVGRVVTDGSGKHFSTIGTAVIVGDEKKACILTAKHVFYLPSENYIPDFVNVRIPKDSVGDVEDLGVQLDLMSGQSTLWKSLDDGSDLAVIDAPDLSKYFNLHGVGLQDFGSDEDVYQGANVLVLGYPGLLGEGILTTPLARSGIISWVDPVESTEKPFLIDANIFNGNSGGPVFRVVSGLTKQGGINLGGGYKFIGIVSQDAAESAVVYNKAQPVQTVDPANGAVSTLYALVKNIGGIGVVEPVSKAKRLVQEKCLGEH